MVEQLLLHLTPPPPKDPNSDQPPLQLYGIFNAEKYKNLWVKLDSEWKVRNESLFEDEDLAVSMNNVAPYLVQMPITHPRITTLLKHYGHDGTLFFWSDENFDNILERMRSLFEIRSNEGDKGYLAFYRPDHFNQIMKSNSQILKYLFMRSDCYFCEDEWNPKKLNKYTFADQWVKCKKIILEKGTL